jgi:hypothetical protein
MVLKNVFTIYDLKNIKSDAHIKVDTLERFPGGYAKGYGLYELVLPTFKIQYIILEWDQ